MVSNISRSLEGWCVRLVCLGVPPNPLVTIIIIIQTYLQGWWVKLALPPHPLVITNHSSTAGQPDENVLPAANIHTHLYNRLFINTYMRNDNLWDLPILSTTLPWNIRFMSICALRSKYDWCSYLQHGHSLWAHAQIIQMLSNEENRCCLDCNKVWDMKRGVWVVSVCIKRSWEHFEQQVWVMKLKASLGSLPSMPSMPALHRFYQRLRLLSQFADRSKYLNEQQDPWSFLIFPP